MLYLKLKQTNIVKTFKGVGCFLVVYGPVELGSLEPTGAQPNCLGFLA